MLFLLYLFLGVVGEPRAQAAESYKAKLKNSVARSENGTVFLLQAHSGKTYLVTNYHVCLQGSWQNTLTGSLESGEVVRGKIVKRDITPDLCAAQVGSRSIAPLTLGSVLSPLKKIHTRGYPFGILSESSGQFQGLLVWEYEYPIEIIGKCPKHSAESYSGTGTLRGCSAIYKDNITNLYARPGASGSPVVNDEGELVGVISSWDSTRDAAGMVRLEDIKEFFKDL